MAAKLLGDTAGAIGDMKHSMLDLSTFQGRYGTGWVYADGSSCVGSLYEAMSGNSSVPTANGYFLRARDHGAGVNPDGDLSQGTHQGDQLGSHGHSGSTDTQGNHNHSPGGAATFLCTGGNSNAHLAITGNSHDSQPTTSTNGAHAHTLSINSTGGNENRPKTMVVNVFIRIN